jgi:glycolate dehydrogenase FAD-binding subunit
MDQLSCLIDGFGPLPLSQPTSVSELTQRIRDAAGNGQAVYPLGGQTALGLGWTPTKAGLAVDVRNLNQVMDYPARDMTITVQAGITMGKLQAILAPENQRLPIDVPRADRATLGGILATNSSSPRRFGHGTLRDYVLGISAVNDEGQEIKAGGRVVKNVAGYDLCKLFIGSLGTLGVITQVTLKLKPLADEHALVSLACSGQEVEPLLDLLSQTRTRPVCLELLNGPSANTIFAEARMPVPDAPSIVIVGFESNVQALEWQMQQLVREVRGRCKLDARLGRTALPLWQALADFPNQTEASGPHVTFKANMLSSGTATFCQKVEELLPKSMLLAHAGNGIVLGQLADLTEQQAGELLKTLRGLVMPFHGAVIVLDCPPAWKRTLDVWGPPRPDVALMREVKNKLDPRNLFNPGRFVDDI